MPRPPLALKLAAGMLLACLLCCAVVHAASPYARLQAGQAFAARHEQGGLLYEARLRLLPRNLFELAESFSWKRQKPLRRVSSGLWFQLRGGSLLWLYNRFGLSRPLNVGAAGALYADMPLPGARGSLSVVFHAAEDTGGSLRLMGVLRASSGGPVFEESGSGLIYRLEGPLPEAATDRSLPLFVEIDARLSGARLSIDGIHAASSRLPSGAGTPPRTLRAVTDAGPWLLELPDGRQFSASFLLDPAADAPSASSGEQTAEAEALPPAGRLDLAGDGLYLSLSLFLRGQELRLALSVNDRAMLHLLGLDALCDTLLALRRWELHGSLLVLYDAVAPRCWLSRRRGEP